MKKDAIELQPVNLPGGGKSVIAWNRPLWMHGADRRRPLRLEVTVAVEQPSPHGMPEGPEGDELEGLKYKLVKLITKRARAEHVMTVTGAAKVVFVFYLPAATGLVRKRDPREALAPVIEKLADGAGRELTVAWFDDPAWSRLLGIFEQHDPAQWKTDRALMIHMAKAGDAIHARRVVAHRCYFPARENCRDFLREARAKLKLKADGGPKKAPAGAPGELVVMVERAEPTLATFHLHPVVLSIKALVTAHKGTYDGWEAELIQSLVPPPLSAPRGG